jgi:hypothetical protein
MPDRSDLIRFAAVATTVGLVAMLRVGWAYLMAKKKAQRAERRFRKGLIAGGMDEEMARRLSEKYIESVRLRRYIRAAMPRPGQRARQ